MTKRTILPILGLIAIIALVLLVYWPKSVSDTATEETLSPVATSTAMAPSKGQAIRDAAWNVFQAYVSAAKAHDLTHLSATLYKLSPTCANTASTTECNTLMDTAFYYGNMIKKDKLTHILYDDKQVVLATDYRTDLEGNAPGMNRTILYFAYKDGVLKLLSFNPFQGAFVLWDHTSVATSTIEEKLAASIKDSDSDFLPDDTELCQGADIALDCVSTNPNSRDTDGDGWWDSIEPFIK